tara:strand:- start:4305 stop:4511 length:207 start_codon:yes stop_codon:yes gene_type:complete
MIDKFKNLDKEQKREFMRVIGWSGTSLIGGVGGAKQVDASFTDAIMGWLIGLVILFIIFRVLRIIRII